MNEKVLIWLLEHNAPQYVLDFFEQGDLKSELEDLKQAKKKMLEAKLTTFFTKYSDITEFTWRQYTSHGHFAVHADEILFEQMYDSGVLLYEEFEQKYGKIDCELSGIMYSLDNIFYKRLFGDPAQVTASFTDGKLVFKIE